MAKVNKLAQRRLAKKAAAAKEKRKTAAINKEAMEDARKAALDAANARQSKKLADKRADDRAAAAKKAAAKKAAAKSSASKSAAAKRAANKKSADAKRAANAAKVAARKAAAKGKTKKVKEKVKKESKTTKTAKGKFFFGTNIPLSAVKDSGKRDEINARLKTDIAAGDWSGANDALFSAAFNTVKGGKGQGNPNVGKVHSGAWKVNKSPLSWAETAINSANDYYPQVDGSVVTWDDSKGALKDGVSSGTWGGQGKGENQQHSGEAPPPAGVRGAAPIGVDTSGKQSALRQRGLRDLNTIFGAGTTGGTTGGAGTGGGRGGFAGDTSGGLLGGQYGGRVGEYQVPNRSFNWQTDPTEQALMASAMGRPDLAQMMLTGQYGPLAGQQYQYGGGQTRINYGAGGAGGAGVGGTGGRLGPLGGAGADTGTARDEWLKTLPTARKDWWPSGATTDEMATWMNANPGKTALDWTNQLPKFGESLAGLSKLFGFGSGRETTTPTTIPAGTGTGRSALTRQIPATPLQQKAQFMATPINSPVAQRAATARGTAYDFPAVIPPIRPLTMGNLDRMQQEAAESRRIATGAGFDFPTDFSANVGNRAEVYLPTGGIKMGPR